MRLITVTSFIKVLMNSLVCGSLNAMYLVGMCNLYLFHWYHDFSERIASFVVFTVFASTRVLWILSAIYVSAQSFAIDWKEVGDFVTELSFFARIELFVSSTVTHMFVMPKQVMEAVALFHPEKNFQPFCAFGGRNHGPRVFALGFPTKDMFETESYYGALPQVPLLLCDCFVIAALGWAVLLDLLFNSIDREERNRARAAYERVNIALLMVTSLGSCLLRFRSIQTYIESRSRYKRWLKERFEAEDVTESELHALRKQWMTHFANPWYIEGLSQRLWAVTGWAMFGQ